MRLPRGLVLLQNPVSLTLSNNLYILEILELDMCRDDKFIVIASDGVWEFLGNDDVANIVYPFFEKRNAEGAAEALVRESYIRWKHEEDDIIDDITCVIIFLDVKLP
jgi:serine/threonine protein phosphatase PrpC